MPTQIHINTGSSLNSEDGDAFRTALIKTEDNFTTLFDLEFPSLFPYTGSARITGSEGQTGDVLGITGSDDPGFNPNYSRAIEIRGADPDRYASASRVIPRNSIYFYITNKSVLSATSQTFIENISTSNSPSLLFRPDTFANQMQFLSASTGQSTVTFNSGNSQNFSLTVKDNQGETLIQGEADSGDNRIGIKTSSPISGKELTINSEISASLYFASSTPTTDPEVYGQWFVGSNDEIFGTPGHNILCRSLGPNPLVTNGLKYMMSPGIVVKKSSEKIIYESPSFNANSVFSSSIRYGASLPVHSTRINLGNLSSNIVANDLYSNEYLYYYNADNKNEFISASSGIFEATGEHTFIWWWNKTSADVSGTDRSQYYMGLSGFSFGRKTSTGVGVKDHLWLNLGTAGNNNNTNPGHKIPYFSSSFLDDYGIDINEWHMIALTLGGSNGAGQPYELYVSGTDGNGGLGSFYTESNTYAGFDLRGEDRYYISKAYLDSDNSQQNKGASLQQSIMMYYSRSLDAGEINRVFNYFSASHGY